LAALPFVGRANIAAFLSGKVLVFAEQTGGTLNGNSLNAITAAQKLGGEITAVVCGSKGANAAQTLSKVDGVKRVLYAKDASFDTPVAEAVAAFLAGLQQKENFSHILSASSALSKSIFPRFASNLDVSPISEVMSIKSDNTFIRPIYAGNALATVEATDAVKVLTIRATSFDAASVGSGKGEIVELADPSPATQTKFVSRHVQKSERPDLTSASVVISGGRGLKSGDNFKILFELADLLGAAVGASRAAVDAGYCPNEMQVGQTGKIVAPQLYIAVGISGAIQHLAGMKDSKNIVCINKDSEAPIFQVSDLGLVADLFTAIPALTEKVKANKK